MSGGRDRDRHEDGRQICETTVERMMMGMAAGNGQEKYPKCLVRPRLASAKCCLRCSANDIISLAFLRVFKRAPVFTALLKAR